MIQIKPVELDLKINLFFFIATLLELYRVEVWNTKHKAGWGTTEKYLETLTGFEPTTARLHVLVFYTYPNAKANILRVAINNIARRRNFI